MYQKVSTDLNFVDREKNVGEFWRNQKIFEKSMTAPDDRTNRCLQQPAKSAINCAAMTWSEQTGSVYCRKRTRFVYESRQYSGPVLSDTRHTSFYADFAGCCIYDLLFYHPGLLQFL